MTEFDSSYYEDIQGRLRGLLILVSDQLPPLTVDTVEELIGANECGVGLEMLSEVLAESGGVLSAAALQGIADLVATMGLDPVNVDRLRPLVIDADSAHDKQSL